MSDRTPQRHRAVTLVELTVSTAVMVVLIGGLASAVVIAGRAIPDKASPTSVTIDGYHTAEQIAGELLCAQSFTLRTSTAVEFNVADRDPLLNPGSELIRYEWSGTPGDPLTRQYNSGPIVEIAEDVHEFDLTYGVKTETETTIKEGTTWSDEIELAYFDGWPGITPTPEPRGINSAYWVSQYFQIPPQEGATELDITLAKAWLRRGSTPPASIIVGVHRSKGDGSLEPDPTPIGTPATIPGTDLETSFLQIPATFSNVTISDISRTDYCLVIRGGDAVAAWVDVYYAKSPPDNGTVLRWTEDGGASWDPRSSEFNKRDLRFSVWGRWAATGQQEITVDRYFVTLTRIALRTGLNPSTRVETSVQVLNAPEVASP